jgi:hypothetical protein
MAFVIAVAGVGTRLRASHARGRRFETRRAHAENAKPGLAAGADAQSGNTAVGSKEDREARDQLRRRSCDG